MASASLTRGHLGQPVTVTIHGRVVDEFGEGIPSAGVSVLRGGQTLKNTQSGQLGDFEVRKLKTKIGLHEVRAAKGGWRPSEEQLPIAKEDEGKSIAIVLRLHQSDEGLIEGAGREFFEWFGGSPRTKEEQDEEEEVVQYIEPEKPYEEVAFSLRPTEIGSFNAVTLTPKSCSATTARRPLQSLSDTAT